MKCLCPSCNSTETEYWVNYDNIEVVCNECGSHTWHATHDVNRNEYPSLLEFIDEDTHVYCTRCVHFGTIEKDEDDYFPFCEYENKCCLWNCEDSTPLRDRPKYKPI